VPDEQRAESVRELTDLFPAPKVVSIAGRAVEIKPDYGAAQKELGLALLQIGDNAGAREALKSYVEISPNAPDATAMKGLIASLGN